MRALILSALLATAAGCGGAQTPTFEDGEWIDLTHSFDDRSLYWPTTAPFVLSTVSEGMTEQGYYYSAYAFQGSEHGGTHLDAPIHFQADRQTTDEVPIDSLIGPAIVIDVSAQTASDRNYGISADDIREWEAEYGQINGQPIVLFNTGSAKLWPDAQAYLGTTRRGPGGVAELSFPGLTTDAADFLANER
jgi:kynurenine formamidase